MAAAETNGAVDGDVSLSQMCVLLGTLFKD